MGDDESDEDALLLLILSAWYGGGVERTTLSRRKARVGAWMRGGRTRAGSHLMIWNLQNDTCNNNDQDNVTVEVEFSEFTGFTARSIVSPSLKASVYYGTE